MTKTSVNCFSNITGVFLRVLRRRVNCHPALCVAELAVDDTPRMGTRAGFLDGLALLSCILQGLANVLVGMAGHFIVFSLVVCDFQNFATRNYYSEARG